MDIREITDSLPDYAKDLRLNLGSVVEERGAPGLNEAQRLGCVLATAIASRNPAFTRRIEAAIGESLDADTTRAARAAAAIMGMNNIYYRFVHEAGGDYGQMPARLRMSVIGNPGVPKTDFELFSLAVSAINGCGLCMKSHESVLRKEGVSAEAIQSAVRIAASVHAVAVVDEYEADASAGEVGDEAA